MEPSTEFDIGRYLRLIYKRRILFALTAVTITTIVVLAAYLMPKVYEASSIIFIERNFLNDLIKNVTVTPSFEEKIKALSVVMKSRNLLMKVMGDLGLDLNNKSAEEIDNLLRNFQEKTEIKVELNRTNRNDMDLFIVSYRCSDPQMASNYVNTLVRRYIVENLSRKRDETYGASRFLLEQINSFKEKLDRTEAEIARLLGDKGTMRNERLLIAQKKLNELLITYTENHPEVVKLRAEIEQLKETASPVGGDTAKGLAALHAGNKSVADLERERDTTKKIYEELLATLGKSEVSTQVEVQDKAGAFRVLDPAIVPSKPVSPNVVRMILLGLLCGMCGAIGVILVMDKLDTSVRSLDTLKTLGLPVLALIPTIETASDKVKARKRERVLYTAVGAYFIVIAAILSLEILGLPYVSTAVEGTKSMIVSAVKGVR